MSIADEIRKLQELHRPGALTDVEFAQAKARVLAGQAGAPQEDVLRDQLAEMKRQNALDRLDREWEHEREQLMVTSRYGNRYRPSKISSIVMAAGVTGFGLVWIFMAASMGGIGGPGAFFPLFGIVFVLFGVGMAAFSFMRAVQYDQAYRRYQRRRALILSAADEDVVDEREDAPAVQRSQSTAIQDASEQTPCWKCGRTIPRGQTECPHCGWMRG